MRPDAKTTEDKIAAFVGTTRSNILSGDTAFRRAYLRAVIDNVEVDDTKSVSTEGGRFWNGW